MKNLSLFSLLIFSTISFGQAPKLHIQLVSHNEPTDNLQTTLNYTRAKENLLEMAAIVNSKNVKWNLQTSDGLVLGALADQALSSTNVFKTLASVPYSDNIQIDPRSKNMNGRNIADQWYLLDSLGANPSYNLGGCIYSSTDLIAQPLDWVQYRNPKIGNIYGNSWQCALITGAGSYPPHNNDLNDFGCFKPTSESDFYSHDPNQNLWCIGTGCAPVLDSLDDEQAIIDLILGQIDSIQTGKWPADKFYVTRIMTNQREYGPLFFQKLTTVLDALSTVPSSQLEWATIGESFGAFQDWQIASSLDYSQWMCGETIEAGLKDREIIEHYSIFPNPSKGIFTFTFSDDESHSIVIQDLSGKVILDQIISTNQTINLENNSKGMYFVSIDNQKINKIIKE